MVSWVVGWLAAMVAALITMPAADAIAIESVQPLATHTYDSPPAPTADAYTHYDRGPPSVLVDLHRHGAGGPGPRGTSARADGVVTATTYTYDSSAELVLVEHRVGLQALKPRTTTGGEGLILGGAASALHSAGVAGEVAAEVAANTVRTFGSHSADDLLQAGLRQDRNGLTAVGRALQKHGGRPGSAYPSVPGAQLNSTGEQILQRIVTNSRTAVQTYKHPNFGGVIDLRLPDVGARFSSAGDFIGFL
jgi:hypothetical protein